MRRPDSRHAGAVTRALLVGLVPVVALGLVARAEANGGALRLARAEAGPYLVSVWSQPDPPRVGRLDVSVAVMRPPGGEAALDVRARLQAAPADNHGKGVVVALERGAGGNLLLYHANVEVPIATRWRMTVEVEGPHGRGAAPFELDVRPARSLAWFLIILVAAVVIAAGIWWVMTHTAARRTAD
jgi:hypothetical protein